MQAVMATSAVKSYWVSYLKQVAPARSLAWVRIIFGALMLISCMRFIILGWVDAQYIAPRWHFPYQGFEWVTTLGSPGMYVVFGTMTLAALGIMLGAWYRVSSVVFALLFTYVELIDKTYYLNHYYFVSIMAFMLAMLPAHRALSVDVWRKPELRAKAIPKWTLDAVKFQIGLVYVFAGIAKISVPWLIDAMPMRIWMPANDTLAVVGWMMTIPWMPWVFSWVGMLYDLTIPFWLLNRTTRPYAYAAVVCFHTITGMMFQIGVFPLVMTGLTTVFFFPSSLKNSVEVNSQIQPLRLPRFATASVPTIVGVVIAVHLCLQTLLPWRYILTTNDMLWDEEGYRFGWRVMLMEKAGTATFSVTDRNTGRVGYVDNAEFLNSHQEKQMAMQPDMILQYAHMLHKEYSSRGVADPIVRVEAWVTLNGQPSKQLVNPTIDLSKEHLAFERNRWVLARQ